MQNMIKDFFFFFLHSRDGVGESQFNQVLNEELLQIIKVIFQFNQVLFWQGHGHWTDCVLFIGPAINGMLNFFSFYSQQLSVFNITGLQAP